MFQVDVDIRAFIWCTFHPIAIVIIQYSSGASLGFIRPKKSFFKSKSKLQSGSGGASTSGGSTGQSRKGLASYKHSFGASQDTQDKEEAEMMRQKVFHKAITDMDFDEPDGPSPSDMSFRLVCSTFDSTLWLLKNGPPYCSQLEAFLKISSILLGNIEQDRY